MVTRRKLLLAFGIGQFAAAIPSMAQQQARIPHIGFLYHRPRPASFDSGNLGAFLKGLRELGYVEGKNVIIEWRFADGKYELLPALAAELVQLKVDVLIAPNPPVVQAARQATASIPIVMVSVGDPVALGFVRSLSRPGANITGLAVAGLDLSGKYLELLRAIVPKISRVASLGNPANPNYSPEIKNIQVSAQRAGVKVFPVEARTAQEIASAFTAATKARAGAIMAAAEGFFLVQQQQIAELAIRHRLPSIFPYREQVEAGGLMSYGPSLTDNFHTAATYVDKILKGAKPADLPIELPSRFYLVINRKTAKTLGLTVSQELLLRADEVIE